MYSHEAFVVPQIVETVLSVPVTAHVAVLQTSLVVVGQLGCWLNKRRPVPYLGNIYQSQWPITHKTGLKP